MCKLRVCLVWLLDLVFALKAKRQSKELELESTSSVHKYMTPLTF
jgi:hypothetical protein